MVDEENGGFVPGNPAVIEVITHGVLLELVTKSPTAPDPPTYGGTLRIKMFIY
jgi:hypothetical protein